MRPVHRPVRCTEADKLLTVLPDDDRECGPPRSSPDSVAVSVGWEPATGTDDEVLRSLNLSVVTLSSRTRNA